MGEQRKWTPGVWKYGRYTQSIQAQDGERLVASLDMRAEESDPTVHADGMVMAAAKEMYEALRDIVEQAERTQMMLPADLADAIKVFGRAALAKADGKVAP